MSNTPVLHTQSFELHLNKDTFAPVNIKLINEDLKSLFEEGEYDQTLALVNELTINLYAAKQVIEEQDDELDSKVSYIESLEEKAHKLYVDNEMLRDELDEQN